MTIEFYVVDSQYLCEVSEEDAGLVRYEDYKSLYLAAQKGLAMLNSYEGIFKNSFHKEAVQALELELSK